MDVDENDMLYTNVFISQPELKTEVSAQSNEEFKQYYKKELENIEERKLKDNLDKISIKNIRLNEDTDENNLLNTNIFNKDGNGGVSVKSMDIGRRKKEIISYVSIDSRDRNKVTYEKPNYFKMFLGKTFYNVKSIKLASIEFPNTNAVINANNHDIYWINKEDIDTDTINAVTKKYPVYNVQLRTGSYITTTLQREI